MDNLGYNYSPEEKPPSYKSSSESENPGFQSSIISPEKPDGIRHETRESLSDSETSLEGDGQISSISPGRCGIFCWKPQWLQRFPTRNYFIIVFLFAATVKGMAGSYFPATITSLEKRLKVDTETIGYVTSGNEVSQILFALILSYVGGKGHRPRWIAVGVMCSAVAYLMMASPQFIYGPGNDALSYTEEYYDQFHQGEDIEHTNSSKSIKHQDLAKIAVCRGSTNTTKKKLYECELGDGTIFPMGLMFSAHFFAGVGSILFYTLAGPFIDDHMHPVKAPIIIALTGAVRQIGPLVGSLIAYSCLKLYISPTLTPLFSNDDDRWIGAWWLGWVIYTVPMALIAATMSLFPRILQTTEEKHMPEVNLEMNEEKGPSIVVNPAPRKEPIFKTDAKDLSFLASVWDLMTNKINLWNNLSLLFFGFAFSGFGTYFPKYLETVLKRNASDAAIISGASSIIFQILGLLLSGWMISRFQLRARTMALVNLVVGAAIVLVLLSFTQLVCKQGQLVDTSLAPTSGTPQTNELFSNLPTSSDNLSFAAANQTSCNSDCNCAPSQISPVCYQDKGLMYYSACHAGCRSYNASSKTFTNCTCLASPDMTLTFGKCVDPSDCVINFAIFVGLIALVRFGGSFGRVGSVLIPYRCVDRSQKSLASGLSFLVFSIVSIPSPIMYGKIIDSTCLRWGTKCGERGNCLLYDDTKFAFAISTTAAGLSLLGLICDGMVWYHVKDLKLYGETEEEKVVEEREK